MTGTLTHLADLSATVDVPRDLRIQIEDVEAGRRDGMMRERPMTVKAILSAKGTEVLTIEPTDNLAAAAKLLAERKIGALVVTGPDQRVVGIVSERDIVQELAAHGPQRSTCR